MPSPIAVMLARMLYGARHVGLVSLHTCTIRNFIWRTYLKYPNTTFYLPCLFALHHITSYYIILHHITSFYLPCLFVLLDSI